MGMEVRRIQAVKGVVIGNTIIVESRKTVGQVHIQHFSRIGIDGRSWRFSVVGIAAPGPAHVQTNTGKVGLLAFLICRCSQTVRAKRAGRHGGTERRARPFQ